MLRVQVQGNSSARGINVHTLDVLAYPLRRAHGTTHIALAEAIHVAALPLRSGHIGFERIGGRDKFQDASARQLKRNRAKLVRGRVGRGERALAALRIIL